MHIKLQKALSFFSSPLATLVYNIFSFIISLISIIIIILQTINPIPAYLEESFIFLDKFFSLIFLAEFIFRLIIAEKKLAYLKWGWIDLLSAIPFYQFKIFRIFKIIAFVRVLKSFMQIWRLKNILKQHNSLQSIVNNSFFAFILLTIIITIISTLSVVYFENQDPNLNTTTHITTIEQAFWWSLVTITTVGYGDLFPYTLGGKITAIILMFFGIGLFSSLTVYTSSFLTNRFGEKRDEKEIKELSKEIQEIKKMIKNLEKK